MSTLADRLDKLEYNTDILNDDKFSSVDMDKSNNIKRNTNLKSKTTNIPIKSNRNEILKKNATQPINPSKLISNDEEKESKVNKFNKNREDFRSIKESYKNSSDHPDVILKHKEPDGTTAVITTDCT